LHSFNLILYFREINIHLSNEEKERVQDIEKFEIKRMKTDIKNEFTKRRQFCKPKKKKTNKTKNQNLNDEADDSFN